MNLSNLSVKAFLDELASGSPAPGGGSTAALPGGWCGRSAPWWPGSRSAGRSCGCMAPPWRKLPPRPLTCGTGSSSWSTGADAYLAVAAARKLPRDGEERGHARAPWSAPCALGGVPLETLLLAGQAVALAARVWNSATPRA